MADHGFSKLRSRHHVPYINSVIMIEGMLKTATEIASGDDKGEWSEDMTPFHRVVFVQAYLELVIGYIDYALDDKDCADRINVPK